MTTKYKKTLKYELCKVNYMSGCKQKDKKEIFLFMEEIIYFS